MLQRPKDRPADDRVREIEMAFGDPTGTTINGPGSWEGMLWFRYPTPR